MLTVCVRLALLLVGAWVLLCAPASAASTPTYYVSRFGNLEFYFTNDLTPVGETYMNILRVYNSFDNTKEGIFGLGWGSFFEESLELQDDGSIIVHEYGGGADNRFVPTTSSALSHNALRQEIMAAAGELGQFGSDADQQAYLKMLSDGEAEQITWNNLAETGLLKQREPPVGEAFFSGKYGTELITRVPEGYQRETRKNGGAYYEAFNPSGELTRIWNKNHDYVDLSYADGHLKQLADNQGNRFALSRNDLGLVSSLSDTNGNTVHYLYTPGGDLVSVATHGQTTRFTYDAKDRLVGVDFPDKTTMRMAYNSGGQVTSVKDADGTVETIAYSTRTTSTATVYSVDSTTKTSDGKTDHKIDQYFYDTPDYLTRLIHNDNGTITDYTYDRDSDILTETTSAGMTTYTYDSLDRILIKQAPGGTTTKWTYDPVTGRPATVATISKTSAYTETYAYDQQGNLAHASDTKGLDFSFVHDRFGRFRLISSGSTQLTLEYASDNAFWPSTIVVAGMGSISLTYQNGAVSKAQSSAGSGVVDKARAMLATINGLVKDAGTSLIVLPPTTAPESKS